MKTFQDGVIPFLFRLGENLPTMYEVKIARFDYSHYDSAWMHDPTLGDSCLVPDVDIVEERHSFSNEQEALTFIANWWTKSLLVEEAVDKYMNKKGRCSE